MTDGAAGFVAALPLPTVLIAGSERIAAANSAAETLLGRNLAGRHFITALRQPALLDAIEATLADGARRICAYLTNDGEQDTTFRVTCKGVPWPAPGAVLVSFEDVTHLEQAGQIRRDFVANVSHELRTPLTALIGFIETLRGPARNDASARDRFLGIMEAEAGRMNRLVHDLLSLSRVEADERVRPTEAVALDDVIREAIDGLLPLADEIEACIDLHLPDDPVLVVGDADQLRQVITNLVENAIKYSGPSAQVDLRLSEPEYLAGLRARGVTLTVSDNGPGIDPHHIPRLTERFYRIDSHRSREMGGTGLGLAIVKHIVNRHRGRLRIESAPGRGTSLTVLLPAAET